MGTLALVAAGVGASPGIVIGLTIGGAALLGAEVGTDIYYATKGNWTPLVGTAAGFAFGHSPIIGNLLGKVGANVSGQLTRETSKLVGGLYGGAIADKLPHKGKCSPVI